MAEITSTNELENWKTRFFTIWSGQAVSLLGSQIVQFALIWWLTLETKSASVVATAALVGLLPQVIFGPLVGTLVDRWNRRIILIVADTIIASAVLVLAFLFWGGHIQIWHVYTLLFVRSVGGSFHWSAMQSSTSLMVPKDQLTRIQGLNQTLSGMLNIGSAPIGALLLSIIPIENILLIDVGTAVIAIIPLFFFPIPQPVKNVVDHPIDQKPSILSELKEGIVYVLSWRGLMILLLTASVINLLLTPAGSLMPILVNNYFQKGAREFALMQSAWGIGLVLGGIILSIWGGFKKKIHTSILGIFIIGIAMTVIGFTRPEGYILAIVMMFLVGIGNPITNGPIFAILQSAVNPALQGRVFTLIITIAAGAAPIGLMIGGPVADKFGVSIWYIIGGIATILIALLQLSIPDVVNIESSDQTYQEKPGQEPEEV